MHVTGVESDHIGPKPGAAPPINAVLLDDSKFDRLRIRRMSRDTGLPIYLDEAGSIEGLQALLDLDQFDLILLDYRLSDRDGIAALEMVRQHPLNGHVPTIMVTGSDDPGLAVRAMRLGCQDFLTKADMTAVSLKEAVEAALQKTSLAHGNERHKRAMAEAASRAAMAEFRIALQPDVAGLVRDMRGIRAAVDIPDFDMDEALKRLETRCVTLWSALGRLGHDRNTQGAALGRCVWEVPTVAPCQTECATKGT